MPFFYFTLQIRFNLLIWTRAIRPVRAQSLQFSKTAKKLNIDLCHFSQNFLLVLQGGYFINTTLKVPGVGFSVAGLDSAKFGFYRF